MTVHGAMLLIKKFNSTTAALASEHSEVRPCESWRRLIRRRQILPCWGRRRTGRHCGSTQAQLEGMASCLLGDLAHLALSHLPTEWSHGLPVRWQESGAKLPTEQAEKRKAGLNKG